MKEKVSDPCPPSPKYLAIPNVEGLSATRDVLGLKRSVRCSHPFSQDSAHKSKKLNHDKLFTF